MKRIFAFLLLLFLPTLVWADMVGYSGDTRRYVTDEEKYQYPYNTVVRVAGKDGYGTGTFVSKDVILTCRNIINGALVDSDVNYITANGQRRTGFVAQVMQDKNKENDYAVIVDKGAFGGDVLPVAAISKQSNNLTVIGYDNLKPLNANELNIVKQLYQMWLAKNEGLTVNNANQAMVDIDKQIKEDYVCSSNKKENCIKCSGNGDGCIFSDGNKMKVRNGCKINYIGNQLYTNCSVPPGAIGAAMIDADSKQIVGILCETRRQQIGQEREPLSLGTKPEIYFSNLEIIIDYAKYDEYDE